MKLRHWEMVLTQLVLTIGMSTWAHAAGGGGLPWTNLNLIPEGLSGPAAAAVVSSSIALGGYAWAQSRHEFGVQRLFSAIMGGLIAVFAIAVAALFGITGAVS